jgi:alkanesulfonate monooxygenase SsuD/methylene tetrahydromethanopterin reductase-like flavin-dependent oxidoreductase (luciferase family)
MNTQLGLTLAQLGPFADTASVTTMAREAEARGYSALWVIDRLLAPVEPRAPYPASDDGSLPPEQHIALDPLVTLATAAAHTTRIRIGTNVLVAPWYRPVLLARSLASLDVLSGGRLDIGIGLGWSPDEYDAVGVPQRGLAANQEQLLDLLDALWAPDPVAYTGSSDRGRQCSSPPTPQQDSNGWDAAPTAGRLRAFRSTSPRPCGPSSPQLPKSRDETPHRCRSSCVRTSSTRSAPLVTIARPITAPSVRSPMMCSARSRSDRTR